MLTSHGAVANQAIAAGGHAAVPAGKITTHTLAVPKAAPPEQAPEQVPGGTAGASLVVVVVLGFVLYRAIEKEKAQWSYTLLAFTAGVLLSGSMVGVMANQVAGSVGQGLTTMFSTVTSSTGGLR